MRLIKCHTIIPLILTLRATALAEALLDEDLDLPDFPKHSLPITTQPHTNVPLNIHITDTTGKDISENINVLHHQTLLSNEDNQKRLTRSYPIRLCPFGLVVMGSFCTPPSPQAYAITCFNESAHTSSYETGSCAPDQLCVDSTGLNPYTTEAYCVSQEDFVHFSKMELGASFPSVGASEAGLPSTGVGSSQYALEAILTGLDVTQSLNASRLQIQAQKSLNVHGHILWSTLPGGSSQCSNCGSVGIDPVPDGTQSIALDLVMELGVSAGNLFLGSWIPGQLL